MLQLKFRACASFDDPTPQTSPPRKTSQSQPCISRWFPSIPYFQQPSLILQQSNELRIFPPSSTNPTTLKQDKGSNSVPVVHDTLAHGPSSTVTSLNARHPLESQVKNWNAQQEQLKLELAKRLGGIGEVVRIGTEKMIVCNVRPRICRWHVLWS